MRTCSNTIRSPQAACGPAGAAVDDGPRRAGGPWRAVPAVDARLDDHGPASVWSRLTSVTGTSVADNASTSVATFGGICPPAMGIQDPRECRRCMAGIRRSMSPDRAPSAASNRSRPRGWLSLDHLTCACRANWCPSARSTRRRSSENPGRSHSTEKPGFPRPSSEPSRRHRQPRRPFWFDLLVNIAHLRCAARPTRRSEPPSRAPGYRSRYSS